MHSLLDSLFDSANLVPRGLCLLWRPELIWLHGLSDGFAALAYFSIPVALAIFASKRPEIEFGWLFWAFTIFIMACGTTHVFGIWTLWFPGYAAEGTAKAITAVASVATAIGMWSLLPKLLTLPLPELRNANEALKSQVEHSESALRALEQEKAERLRAEEMLRALEQHQQIERLIALTPDAVVVVDVEGIVQFANEAAVKLFDRNGDSLLGGPFGFSVKAGELSQIRISASGGQRTGDMRVVDCEWADMPARLIVIRDNTERERVEIESKVAEEKFRLAVESCPNGMVMIDAAGTILLVNAETEKLFGYRREDLIGQSIEMLVPPRFRANHPRHRRAFNARPTSRKMGAGRDLFGLRKDGTEFPVEVGLTPVRTQDGMMILSVVTDITERKRNERLKDDFVSTVSHELRTPLTSISGSLGLLLGQAAGKLPEPVVRLLTVANANSQRLVRLLNDILDIEKVESGKVVFNLRRVEVRSLVEQAIDANRGFAESYRVRVRLDAASVAGEVRVDPDRLVQVVTNLLSNAVKFSPREAEVIAAVETRADTVRISVRDCGPGIPAEFKSRVFEKFAQADASDARQKGGTGLGLSIVKQLVSRLGGEVGFDDAPGGGTIFWVELPAWDHAAADESGPGANQGPRILLCEDDPEAAAVLRDRLREAGFAVEVAHTAEEAAASAAAVPYAAILVDLRLPDSDGISLIRQLRAQPRTQNTPIVVVSADPGSGRDDSRSSTLNVLDWLAKPVDVERLVRVLERPAVRNGIARPHILHVDDDDEVLRAVAGALGAGAEVVSVHSVEEARRALAAGHFDLALLDVMLAAGSGLDLLPDLVDAEGDAIPVVVMSAQGTNPQFAAQLHATLTKSHASIDSLVATLRRRVAGDLSRAPHEEEVA